MAMNANREDPNRRFLATQQYWPNGKELVFRFRLFSDQGERPLPSTLVSAHGEGFGPMFYVIDELDNCLVLEDNQPIQVHLDPNAYVPELMDPETLDNVSRVFHIKYTRIDEESSVDLMVLSGYEPSDDQFSSDGDENNDQDGTLVGDNPHNLIDLSSGSSLSLEVNKQSNAANELSDLRLCICEYWSLISDFGKLGRGFCVIKSVIGGVETLRACGQVVWKCSG
ncbi:uncharacterized protein DS421_19g660450 [Arachis hypogaea]|uniref:Uncharacterized protein n=1 Tax=Arachis hypogaea TaxID=3818 RepID=A0A6B9VA06_ARAHY|nr:uncharacterized protein DS421_19g660450 [Arachis hypogaea]